MSKITYIAVIIIDIIEKLIFKIKNELINKYKIRKNAFKIIIGFGKEKPVRNPDNEDWESYDNRRVEVIIVNYALNS